MTVDARLSAEELKEIRSWVEDARNSWEVFRPSQKRKGLVHTIALLGHIEVLNRQIVELEQVASVPSRE